MSMMELYDGFDSLVNKEFYFYGVKDYHFMLDDMVLIAIVAEHHSMGESFLSYIGHDNDYDISYFPKKPLARIKIVPVKKEEHSGGIEGWILVDVDTNHIWLTMGTDYTLTNSSSYAFYYTPDDYDQCINVDIDYVPYRERHPEEVVKYPNWFGGETI